MVLVSDMVSGTASGFRSGFGYGVGYNFGYGFGYDFRYGFGFQIWFRISVYGEDVDQLLLLLRRHSRIHSRVRQQPLQHLGRQMSGYLEKGIHTPMARGRFT